MEFLEDPLLPGFSMICIKKEKSKKFISFIFFKYNKKCSPCAVKNQLIGVVKEADQKVYFGI